jgi:NADPH2:quinone reductase
VGIDTLALSSIETADVLQELAPGLASGALKPFPIRETAMYPLERAAEAYRAVIGSSRDRIVLLPQGKTP